MGCDGRRNYFEWSQKPDRLGRAIVQNGIRSDGTGVRCIMSNFHPLFPMTPAAVSPLPLEKRMPKAAAFIVQGPRLVEGRVEYRTWAAIAEAVDAVIYDEDGRELRTVSLA